MSYTIEYGAEIYRIPKDPDSCCDELSYLWIVTEGDNNVYECDNHRRARDDYIIAYGWNYSIISKVCSRAGVCEGGGLQPGGKWMKPENYLHKYRVMIENAWPIEQFFAKHKTARIHLRAADSDYAKEQIEKYRAYIHPENNHYHPEEVETWAEVTIKDMDTLKIFLDLWGMAIDHNYASLK